MSRFHRWLLKTARTIHVYLTLFGLTLILFFAVTGFMLNHMDLFLPSEERLKGLERVEVRKLPLDKMPNGKLPEPPADGSDPPAADQLPVIEALRKEFDIRGEKTSFSYPTESVPDPTADPALPESERPMIDKRRIKVEFVRAGATATATIDRDDATTEVRWANQGWPIILTDLHRGNRGNVEDFKRTGFVWTFVIDLTCVIMLVISATGLIMWWSLKSRGKWGAILFVVGTAWAVGMYFAFVP